MSVNSSLVPVKEDIVINYGYHSPVLLRESSISRIYRISKAGKHFIFKTAKDDSGRMRALVRREYDISIGLDHPHIVNVFTFEDDTEVGPGIVMEYVDGRDLSDFLSEDPSMQMRRRVADQILDAVGYMHRKGIIHNDLKPENIFISRKDNSVKLLDFGLSDNDAYYLAKAMGSTAGYASPELLRQEKTDSRSDIYSLGILLDMVLDGRNSRISGKCRSKDRNKRYDNVGQVRAALARRHYPVYFSAAAILIIILAVAGLQVGERVREFKDFQSAEQAKKEMCDSVYNAIDTELLRIYGDLETRLSDIPYKEFGYMELSKTMSVLPGIWKSFQNITDDQALISGFISHYTLIQNDCYEKALRQIEAIPSITEASLPAEEFNFYMELIGKEEPYRPYGKYGN